ncbi:hypothetical protein L596_000704 [Steinernema carpocapsae]|uniref:Uncharacterized protein n=1 Tax=Steinernema carpocapsae TaxID=34508 RepID=A0A4U8UJP5_STECR|nr:hypothetical protein L596_000704 [Steinernema carpocapsae]
MSSFNPSLVSGIRQQAERTRHEMQILLELLNDPRIKTPRQAQEDDAAFSENQKEDAGTIEAKPQHRETIAEEAKTKLSGPHHKLPLAINREGHQLKFPCRWWPNGAGGYTCFYEVYLRNKHLVNAGWETWDILWSGRSQPEEYCKLRPRNSTFFKTCWSESDSDIDAPKKSCWTDDEDVQD